MNEPETETTPEAPPVEETPEAPPTEILDKDFGKHGILKREGLAALGMPQLVELYNAKSDKPVKVFSKKDTAVQRVWELYEAPKPATTDSSTDNNQNEDDMAKKNAKAAKKAAKAPKEKKEGAKGRSPKFELTAKIKVIVDKNPKREGSASYKRFQKYETGMTVEEALKKGVTSGDINWDVAHNFIALK